MLCRKPSIRSCLLHATVPSIPFVGTLRHIGMCGAVRSWALPVRFDRWLMLTVSHNHHPSFDASPFCSVNANSSAMYTRPSAITVTKGIPCARKSFATAKAPLRVSFTAFIIPAGSLGLPCTMNHHLIPGSSSTMVLWARKNICTIFATLRGNERAPFCCVG